MQRVKIGISVILLGLMAWSAVSARRTVSDFGYLPIVSGSYPGQGEPTQSAPPASVTPAQTATVTRTTTPSPTSTERPDGPPTQTPTPSATATLSTDNFVNVSVQTGIDGEHVLMQQCGGVHWGSGSAWADVDNDGDIDLFTTNHGGANRLYRNDGDSNADLIPEFVDIAVSLGVDDPNSGSTGSVFIDYDNDGDQDLYINQVDANKLYENQKIDSGSFSFLDVSAFAGAQGAGGLALMSDWGDYDQDGFLDFYITRHNCSMETKTDQLFHNNGDGTFDDVSAYLCPAGTAPCNDLEGLGFATGWVDYDNDGDLDIYQANDQISPANEPNKLWRNDGSDGIGGWIFTNQSANSDSDVGVNSMGLGVGDYNNDGWLDLAVSNIGPIVTLKNEGDGSFYLDSTDSGVSAITAGTSWATVFFDQDNDGWLDLYLTRGNIYLSNAPGAVMSNANMLLGNDGDGTFSNISAGSGISDLDMGRNASIVDINADGYVDVLLNNLDTELRFFLNQQSLHADPNHWLVFTVEGTTSNRDAIGTRFTLAAGGLTQIREITTGPTHGGGDFQAAFFGLGTETTADVTVRWPDGTVQNLGSYNADQYVHLVEPLARPGTALPTWLAATFTLLITLSAAAIGRRIL